MLSMQVSEVITGAKKVYARSDDHWMNFHPSELHLYVLVSVRLKDPCMITLY